MTRVAFVRQWEGARASRVISSTSAAGGNAGTPVTDAAALGRLRLRASGVPDDTYSLEMKLATGGNVTGYADPYQGVPGASLIHREVGVTPWTGYSSPAYLQWAKVIGMAGAVTDYPGASAPRELADGSVAFLRTQRGVSSAVEFLRKTSRFGGWVETTVTSTLSTTGAAAFVEMPSGRLVAFVIRTSGNVHALYSDDTGATWSTWSTDTGVRADASWGLHAERVGDHIMLIASYEPTQTAADAKVYWSFDGGQRFALASSETWGPVATCTTRTGQVLVTATNRSTTTIRVYTVPPGGAPALLSATGFSTTGDADDTVQALVTMDDGTIWHLCGGGSQPAPRIQAQISRDHGLTWTQAAGAVAGATIIWRLGIDETTPYGFRVMRACAWQGRILVLGVTDVSTGTRDDTLVEMHLGGWDQLTDQAMVEEASSPNGFGGDTSAWLPIDLPNNLGWTKTDVAAGATIALAADGLNIVGTAANNSYYTASNYVFPSGTQSTWRLRYWFSVASDGSVADDRAIVRLRPESSGTEYAGLRIRHSTDQIRVVDGAGTTLATTVSVANRFNDRHEVRIFVDALAATPTISVYVRQIDGIGVSDAWTEVVAGATLTETVGTPEGPVFGGTAAGAVDWKIGPLEVSEGDMGFSGGFTNPDDLAGRQLEAAYDIHLTGNIRIGAAGGAGIRDDEYTLATDASYSAQWLWKDARPSAKHKATGDNASHAVVFDAEANNAIVGDWVGVVGTNFRTATWQMHTADSWATPSVSVNLDATLATATVATIKSGLGFVGVDGMPWIPHQWRSQPGARVFVEVGGVVYEVDDNDEDRIYVDGVGFGAASGTLYVFGDRMGASLPSVSRYRYGRLSVSAQQTADDAYEFGTLWIGSAMTLTDPWANGFVRSDVENVDGAEGRGGHGVRFVAGPTRRELRVAWDPIDRLTSKQADWLRHLYRALRGGYQPVALVDLDSRTAWGLYTLAGPFARENVTGDDRDALERIAQLVLREVV